MKRWFKKLVDWVWAEEAPHVVVVEDDRPKWEPWEVHAARFDRIKAQHDASVGIRRIN